MNKIIIIAGNEKGCGVTTMDISKLRGQYLVVNTETGNIQNLSTDSGYIVSVPFVANQTSIENSGDEYVDALASLIELIGDKTKVQLAYEKVYSQDENELELETKLKEANEYIAQLETELRHAITKEELDKKDKEIDELKKEIEYLKPRTWFADAMDNFCKALDLAAKEFVKLTSKEPPRKKLTKREKFWHDVKENIIEYGGQWICVYPKDYGYFIKELEKEIPTMVWGNGAKPSEFDPWMLQKRRYIYLANDGFIYWSSNPAKSIKGSANKKVFAYYLLIKNNC